MRASPVSKNSNALWGRKMVFWLAVLTGVLFAWIAVRIGFYAAWILFFHLLLAACGSIFLTPVIVAGVPAATSIHGFGHTLTLMSIAVATLFIGYGTCYACLSGRLQMPFPRFLDSIGAGVLGFLAGFLVWSFLLLALTLTPVAQYDLVKRLGFDPAAQQTNIAYLCWWCDGLHYFVSPWGDESTSRQAVDLLMAKAAPPIVEEKTPDGAPPKSPPPTPAVDTLGEPDAEKGAAEKETPPLQGTDKKPIEPQQPVSDLRTDRLSPRNELREEDPIEGPLSGPWVSSGGARFYIDDDGQTLSVDLTSSDSLLSLTGSLTRRGEVLLTGTLEVVFKIDPAKHHTIDVTGTIPDSDHLRLRCTNWPKWNSRGKYLGKTAFTEFWTRGRDVFTDPFRPQ